MGGGEAQRSSWALIDHGALCVAAAAAANCRWAKLSSIDGNLEGYLLPAVPVPSGLAGTESVPGRQSKVSG